MSDERRWDAQEIADALHAAGLNVGQVSRVAQALSLRPTAPETREADEATVDTLARAMWGAYNMGYEDGADDGGANWVELSEGARDAWRKRAVPILAVLSPRLRASRQGEDAGALKEQIDAARRLADQAEDDEERAYHEGRANGLGEAAAALRSRGEAIEGWVSKRHHEGYRTFWDEPTELCEPATLTMSLRATKEGER